MAQLEDSLDMPFDEMIRARTKAWKDEYDQAAVPRLSDAVNMTFRKRGDYFGYFFGGGTRRSQWRSFPGKGMVTYPVIGRSIRSKIATSCSTKVQIEVEAIRDVPEKQAGAEIARSILRFEDDRNWTQRLEAASSEMCQLQRYCWLYNDYKGAGGMAIDVPVTETRVKKSGQTLYTCANCGFQHTPEDLDVDDIADEFKDKDLAASNDITHDDTSEGAEPANPSLQPSPAEAAGNSASAGTDPDADGDSDAADPEDWKDDEANRILEHTAGLVCPNPDCQAKALVMTDRAHHEQVEAYTGEYQKLDTGFFDTQVISPLLTRIDSYPCIGFEYRRAGWFNYHPLIPLYELIAMAPHLAEIIGTGAGQWSEQARWHYELNQNTSSSQGFSYRSKTYRADELVEPDVWFIQPHACLGWTASQEWTLNKWTKDDSGSWQETTDPLFTIREGETIEDAVKRETGVEEFKGLLLVMWRDHIIGIGAQAHEYYRKFIGMPWKIDAQSFYPQGEENLLKLQDAATNVLSMMYSYQQRASLGPLVVDPMGGFDENAVAGIGQPGKIIYRKPLQADVTNQNWQHFLGYLAPGPMSEAIQNFITLIIDIAKEESGVFNETVGNNDNAVETLGAHQLNLNQSLSLLTPTQQAKAFTKVDWSFSVLEHWQTDAPDEAFALVKGTFEEEWKPEDIEAFKSLDIERELAVTVVEGTDVPRTQIEMEQRYITALQTGLFNEPNPLPLQIRAHIIKSVLGIDFDIGNYQAFKRLAARRYQQMKLEMAMVSPQEALTIVPDPTSGYPVRQLRPEVTASLLQDIRTAPEQTDAHLVFIEYFTDQLNGLLGAKEPDELMVEVCKTMISAHRAFVAQASVQAQAVEGLAQGTGQQMAGSQNGIVPAQQPQQQTAAAGQ